MVHKRKLKYSNNYYCILLPFIYLFIINGCRNLLQKVGIIEEPTFKSLTTDEEDHTSIIEDLKASGLADQAGIIKNSLFLQTLEDVHKDEIEEDSKENTPLT